jgi:hypothetical protein
MGGSYGGDYQTVYTGSSSVVAFIPPSTNSR